MPRRVALSGAILVMAPLLQILVERSVALPVGPSRMLTIALWLFAWVPIALFGLERLGVAPGHAAGRAGIALLVPALGLTHLLVAVRFLDGPFGPVPGGPLAGPVSSETDPDWGSVRGLLYAELEVQPERPRSLETLVLVHDQVLYVAANMPEGKRWPAEVRNDERVRIRVDGPVHERRAHWVEDARDHETLLAAMNAKYGFDVSLGGEIWFFRLDPR